MTALGLVPLDLGRWAAESMSGSLLIAVPVAVLAGLVSFFSPCVLPLLPGYLSYATGLSASEVMDGSGRKGRMVAGTLGFILGFALVFIASGVLVGSVGKLLLGHARTLTIVLGVVTIVLGLMFAGVLRFGQRDLRFHRLPKVGVAASPLLGIVFGLGWTPCIGPTLGAVLTLSLNEGSSLRGGILSFAYAMGLGIPFLIAAVAFGKMARATELVRRHQGLVMKMGGGLMVLVGVLLLTGLWDVVMGVVRNWAAGFGTVL